MAALVPPVPHERGALLAFLAQQRYLLRVAAYGLTPEQLRAAPTVSSLSVGGLLRHAAMTEGSWIDTVVGRRDVAATDYTEGFTVPPDWTIDDLLDRYDAVAARTEDVVAGLPLDHPVPVPRDAPWFPRDVEAWSLRWVLLHLITETARHAGHADIVRETLDGATAYPLLAAAEGWPATPWLQPWQPAAP